MKTLDLEVENIKCSGCANSITKSLLGIEGVLEVKEVDLENQIIHLNVSDDCQVEPISDKLKSMGYPPKGDNDWFLNAKSYVSCAIGKVTK